MTRNKITQKEAIFYRLYLKFVQKDGEYLPVHALIGEIYCPEVGKWGYVSYECSARASEMVKQNPQLIQRTMLTGKSGAHYYGYRINPTALPEMIVDEDLKALHRRIRNARYKPTLSS